MLKQVRDSLYACDCRVKPLDLSRRYAACIMGIMNTTNNLAYCKYCVNFHDLL